MKMEKMPYIWLAVIILGVMIETMTAQLVSIWIVLGAAAALICSCFTERLWIQLTVFAAVTVFTLFFTRPLVRKRLDGHQVPTNADRVIGQTALVTEPICNARGTGQVNVAGQIWSARSADQDIPAGELVTVQAILGVKLTVLPKK